MRYGLILVLSVLFFSVSVQAGEWTVLFDGGSTAALENPYDWGEVEVEDGVLCLRADRKFFLCSRDEYSDFVFEADVKLPKGRANSGFMFRAEKSPNSVRGYQAEVDGDAARAWSGGIYGEGIGAWKFQPRKPNGSPAGEAFRTATTDAFDRDGWNSYKIHCEGNRLRVFVNDVLASDYIIDERDSGVVALQHHGEKGQTYRFRNVRIKKIDQPQIFGWNMVPVFDHDFNDLKMKDWQASDSAAWKLDKVDGSGVLNLHSRSDYKPPVRSPESIIWLSEDAPASFVLDAIVKSTEDSHAHRDICLFFGKQDDEHFYYAHIAEKADPHAHSIFAVDGSARKSIATERNDGIRWGDDWHRVRVERDGESGAVRVYFDDLENPIMQASDKRFLKGGIGIGSFDNTAYFDDVRLVGGAE